MNNIHPDSMSVSSQLVELLYGDPTEHSTPNAIAVSSAPQQIERKNEERNGVFQCGVCERSFKEGSHYMKHKKSRNCKQNRQRDCRLVPKRSSVRKRASSKGKKQSSDSPEKPFQCNLCGSKFCDKGNVILHLLKNHHTHEQMWSKVNRSSGVTCDKCDLWFPCKVQLDQHSQQHEVQREPHLGMQDPSQSFYQPLMTSNYPTQMVPYPTSYQLPPPPSLHHDATIPMVNGNNAFTSSHTPLMAEGKKSGRGRLTKDHFTGTKENTCVYCNIQFFDSLNLETHVQRNHSNSDLLAPPAPISIYCSSNSSVSKHPMYECGACKQKLCTEKEVSEHMEQAHHASTPRYLPVSTHPPIKRTRKTKSIGTKNISVQYQCQFCMKKFNMRADLLRHKLKQRNIVCGVCGFASCSDTHVALHMYTEHNELIPRTKTLDVDKSYAPPKPSLDSMKCVVCNASHTPGTPFVEHLLLHKEGPIECTKCSFMADSLAAACHHMRRDHANQIVKVNAKLPIKGVSDTYTVFMTPSIVAESLCNKAFWTDTDALFVYCSLCRGVVKGQAHLEAHVQTHDPNYSCSSSDAAFDLCSLPETVDLQCQECHWRNNQLALMVTHCQRKHFSSRVSVRSPLWPGGCISMVVFSPITRTPTVLQ